MAAATFKVRCLRVIREVQATREPVVITKRGAPVGPSDACGFGEG
jgi:prevent-host-death family protein